MNWERQFDRFWNGLLLAVFLAAPVVVLLTYLLPPSVFPGGERMCEGILACAVFLWLLVSAYCILCGLAGEWRQALHRRRKRRHPQTAEDRAYAECRYTVLPDIPPALLRERMAAWVKKNEEAEGCVEIWEDTAEHYALSCESADDCYCMAAAFSGEDYVLALSFPSAENDYARAAQQRLIPASLHRAWKKILMTWETYDIPVNALLIRHEGQLRLYPEGAEGKVTFINEQFVEMYKVQSTMYKSSSSCGFAAVEITLAAPTAAAPNARRFQDDALQALSVPRFSAADLYIVLCTSLQIPF